MVSTVLTPAASGDPLLLEDELSVEDRELAATVRAFVDEEVLPCINDHWERAEFPRHILPAMAELGVRAAVALGRCADER